MENSDANPLQTPHISDQPKPAPDQNQPKKLTTTSGFVVADNQNSMTAGRHGPIGLQDFYLIEKHQQFNRERIPERVVHAKGHGAHGTFTVTHDISQYTCAKLLNEIGKQTPVFMRFSTVGGESGSADSARDPRGFSIKFYAEDGNWDLVGNNTPVFFIRDGIKFPDFIHTQKRCPRSHLQDQNMRWDFWSLSPEALHQVMILYSDRGTPLASRFMNGYGSHTFSLINEQGQRIWCKWHFKTNQGIRNFTDAEAGDMSGKNPDYATEDLFRCIEDGNYPSWTVYIQTMTDEQAQQFPFDPFDLTKVWPHGDFPLIEVGQLELNRNVENYFAEVEQASFSPNNIVHGLGFSPDRMLQARLFAYQDAHRYRIGTNYQLLPINAPRCPMHNYAVDGSMRFDGNMGRGPNYEPNSDPNAPKEDRSLLNKLSPMPTDGELFWYDHREVEDHYQQPGDLYRLFDDGEKARLVENITGSLKMARPDIQDKMVALWAKCDADLGERLSRSLAEAKHGDAKQAKGFDHW